MPIGRGRGGFGVSISGGGMGMGGGMMGSRPVDAILCNMCARRVNTCVTCNRVIVGHGVPARVCGQCAFQFRLDTCCSQCGRTVMGRAVSACHCQRCSMGGGRCPKCMVPMRW